MAFGFSKGGGASVALVDITSSSVGGALAHISPASQPILYYVNREPIEQRDNEELSVAMLRTLEQVASKLIAEGAPVLHQEIKSGSIDRVYVSVGTPWQATTVRTEHVNETKPFVFTKAFLTEAVRKSSAVKEGYLLSGESVIATLLNGYEVVHPFGKKVTRAELIVLSSLIEKKIADAIESTLRNTYHTHALTLTAFAPIVYTAFRDLFPHEKDFLVVNVSGEATDVVFIKRSILVDVASEPHGLSELARTERKAGSITSGPTQAPLTDVVPSERFSHEIEGAKEAWLKELTTTLRDFATKNALPRTLFLLTEDSAREYIKNLLDSESLRSLWLTDEPLAIIPILPNQFGAFVKSRAEAGSDVSLSLLALFSAKQHKN